MEPTMRNRSSKSQDQMKEMTASKGGKILKQQELAAAKSRRPLLARSAAFVIFLLYLLYKSSSYNLFNRKASTSATTLSTKDSVGFSSKSPLADQEYAVCSFQSYPPSKTSSRAIPRIYTVDSYQEQNHGEGGPTQCIIVNDGKIQSLASGDEVHEWCGEKECDVRVLDEGQSILPGLHDAHGHILDHGISLSSANLVGCTSTSEIISRLESFVQSSPSHMSDASKWIEGLGWDQTKFSPPIFPTSEIFESSDILRGRKIVLKRIDVHALWVSKSVIDQIKDQFANRELPEKIDGGLILRDKSHEPTGIFIDNAMNLVIDVQPKLSLKEREKFLDHSIEELLSFGITNVGDAALEAESYGILKKKEKENRLKIRVWGMLDCSNHEKGPFCGIESAIESSSNSEKVELTPKSHSEIDHRTRFTLRAVKLFIDGALGSWGSSMWEDYNDREGERGLLLMDETETEKRIRGWNERGFQVASHAIGDRANSILLSIYSKVIQEAKDQGLQEMDPRFRIEHSQILRKEDIPKFSQYGIIASMQPTHCTSDMGYVETRIGERRAREGAYVWRDLVDSNATLIFGSDFPVESPSIFEGFFSSITRLDPNLDSPHGPQGWFGKQKLSRIQTLKAFTTGPSFGQFEEHLGGSLSVGKRADYVVIDRDVMDEKVGLKELRETRVLNTVIDGEVAWSRMEKGT